MDIKNKQCKQKVDYLKFGKPLSQLPNQCKNKSHDFLNVKKNYPGVMTKLDSLEALKYASEVGFYDNQNKYEKRLFFITSRNIRLWNFGFLGRIYEERCIPIENIDAILLSKKSHEVNFINMEYDLRISNVNIDCIIICFLQEYNR